MRRATERVSPSGSRLRVRARDGLALAVTHHAPPASMASGDAPAVLLLPGLASSGLGYDLPGRSFAKWLAMQGAHCFVAELRGHGDSERPARPWSLDDYIALDIPALLDALRERTGAASVRWLGHSMGGILLLAYGSLFPDAPIACGVTVGSALDYTAGASGFRPLMPLLRAGALLDRIPSIPYGHYARALAPLLGRTRFFRPDTFNIAAGNAEPDVIRAVYRGGFGTIPVPLLVQLAGMFTPDGLRVRVDGKSIRVLDRAKDYRIPTLMVGGAADEQVSVASVRASAAILGVPARVRVFARATGDRADYGHWDLLVGSRAEHEVWPVLADALLGRSPYLG